MRGDSMSNGRVASSVAAVPVVIVVLAILVFTCMYSISVGTIGIVTQFGKVTGRILKPGLNVVAPWQGVERMDCRIQKLEGETECFSRDLQVMDISIAVMYHMREARAVGVYSTIGKRYMEQVAPRIWEVLKQKAAQYDAESVIGKRDEIRMQVLAACKERFSDIVDIDDLALTNISFSDVYERAIEQKQVAQQEALRAKYELERAKTEAEKAIEVARGEAEAIRVRGEALKENPGVAQLEAIKKWDGHAPQSVYLGGASGADVPVVFPVK